MLEPVEPLPPTQADDPETRAMVARIQARLFDMAAEPVRVGRFELLRMLGAGGMGVVHVGRDELLDRQVALKLIRRERTQSETARSRLLREAQAMARLSHPNVVQIYEAGEQQGVVFIAMELVEGQTLREWIDGEGQTRPWRDRLRVLLAAGRGLAAAHEAGVVHRDFKPENVLLDAMSEPKVGDFGLAGVEATSRPALDEITDGPLTQTGALLGTPRYMAPEQLEAGTVDARSDQFAFCVVAYELLVGQRPFEGATLIELSEHVISGVVAPVPSGCPVPRWLLAAILRGLEVDPTKRWPSMGELLDAMTPRRSRLGLLVAIGAGLAVALALTWAWPGPASPSEPGSLCERGRSELADAWGPTRRDATKQALHDTGLPYADDTFTRIAGPLDAYASDWADGFFRACTDEQAGRQVDARMACLERAHQDLRLVTDELVAGQPDAVRHASDLVLSLPDLERCDDPMTAGYDAVSLEDPEVRALVDDLTRASILVESWRFAEADALLERLDEQARALKRDRLVARVGVLRSTVALARAMPDDSVRFARDALTIAERAKHEELELLAWRRLAIVSRREGEHSRAAFELERAEAIAERPTISATHRADLRFDRADLLARQGQYADAVAAYEAAHAAYRALSPEHPEIVRVLSDMALAQMALGRQDVAIEASEQALAIQTRRLGEEHPSLVPGLSSVADQYMAAGRPDDALALRRRALAILELEPSENPGLQVSLAAVIGGDLVSLRRFDEAERVLADADARARTHLAPEHSALALIANARGNLELDRRRYGAAIPHYERALTIIGETGSPNRTLMLANLSLSLARAGRTDDASERAEQTRGALEALAPDSALRVALEIYLAEVDRLTGRHAQARASFERANERLEQLALGDDLRLMITFGLAQTEPNRQRARAHALRAQALAEAMPGFETERSEIAAWLTSHP